MQRYMYETKVGMKKKKGGDDDDEFCLNVCGRNRQTCPLTG